MRLRHLIRGPAVASGDRRTPARIARIAREGTPAPPTLATLANIATPEAAAWPSLIRGATVDGVQIATATDILESLMAAGAIDAALRLGWDVREIVGLSRSKPHDHPLRAGLVFSMRPGDAVVDLSRAGCVIAYGNVRHIWRRTTLDASIMLPLDLAAWLAERGSHAA